ncbi:MAG: ABC transporter permease [Trueperaceae bacterium]|nr:ABC transporter permease [Trueperaceae bacterium]
MMRFLAVRTVRGVATLIAVVALTFALGRATGDPVALLLPQGATVDDVLAMRARLGLDRPLPVQFGLYLGDLLRGDFGTSLVYNRPALAVVAERVPATLRLGAAAFAAAILVAGPLGVFAALRRDTPFDRAVRDLSLTLQSLPSFFVGIVGILVFGVVLRWLPTFGDATLQHYVLPVATLTLLPLALLLRLVRASLLEVLHQDYVRTAHAKGLPVGRVVTRHALRTALIPVVTILGLQLANLIGGAVIVETVFAWPGVGSLAVEAIGGRDFAIVQTVVLLSGTAFVVMNLLVDLSYAVLDPRVEVAP